MEALHVEEFRNALEHAAGEKLERGVGRLVGVALRLALLHDLEQAREARIVRIGLDPESTELGQEVGLSGLVGDQDGALVADALRRHMFVGAWVLRQRRGMNTSLGGES